LPGQKSSHTKSKTSSGHGVRAGSQAGSKPASNMGLRLRKHARINMGLSSVSGGCCYCCCYYYCHCKYTPSQVRVQQAGARSKLMFPDQLPSHSQRKTSSGNSVRAGSPAGSEDACHTSAKRLVPWLTLGCRADVCCCVSAQASAQSYVYVLRLHVQLSLPF
jgi:hypothetical protein